MSGVDYLYHKELGYIIITGTEKGISSIKISPEKPNEELINTNEEIKECKKQLREYFLGNRKEFNLKLDIQGSDFRKKVWNELMKIPYGETISYGEQAKRIGNPKGSRAVGQANGDNPILIVIPCHRVIGKNGKLNGFSSYGGIKTKEFLIKLEKVNSNVVYCRER